MVSRKKIEFPYEVIWFENPHMYADGKWACCIDLGEVPGGKFASSVCRCLRGIEVHYFFRAINGHVFLHVQ